MMQGNNVTYTGKTWRKKTYWEDHDMEVPESPKFLHRPPRHYSSYYAIDCILPSNFHYYGMNKIKGGKGYDMYGHPRGIIGGPCPECDGTIINLQMNTSAKGMECTSEKVCDTCGLIIDGAFSIYRHRFEPYYIREPKIYHTNPFSTHEEWLERMKELDEMQGNPEDIALDAEMFCHATGNRMSDSQADRDEAVGNVSFKEHGIVNTDEKLARTLGLKTKNAANYGNSSKEVMQWKNKQHYDYIDICKTILGMHRGQVASVRYILDNVPNILNISRYNAEDIIVCICLVVMSDSIPYQRMGGIIKKLNSTVGYNKTLYNVVADKLNNQPY